MNNNFVTTNNVTVIDWEQATSLSKVYHVNANIEDQRDLPKDMLGPIIVNDNNEPIVIRYPLEKQYHTQRTQ
jgi:hypothetical protein